jgi:hypothetical protein
MAVLSERQKKAATLAAELGRCNGCWVVSPLPLSEDARGVRFQLLDKNRDEVITELCASNWIPTLVSPFPRFTGTGLVAAGMYEIVIEKERVPAVTDTPKVEGEMAEAAKREEKRQTAEYIKQFRKSAGMSK